MSTTGIAGLTLHGGYGHLRRKYGLNIDNLLSAEIVTADGQVRTASRSDNVDLFWALRGAGSNFLVVTSLLEMSGPIPFTAVQAAFDPFFPKGRLYYWKSTNVHDLSDACIDTILAAAAARLIHVGHPDLASRWRLVAGLHKPLIVGFSDGGRVAVN